MRNFNSIYWYKDIIFCSKLPENYLEFKEFLEKEFKNKGSCSRLINSITPFNISNADYKNLVNVKIAII